MARIVERKPHPNSVEHEVVVFRTKVGHEMEIPRGATEREVRELIRRYLKGYDIETPEGRVHVPGYEDIYPETREEEGEKGWVRLLKAWLKSRSVEERARARGHVPDEAEVE